MSRGGWIRDCVHDALRVLGIRHFTLCIHDASFPADDGEDVGRGSPHSRGARRFLRFVHTLGFTGVQLGPQGETPPNDPSPYRSSAFPRNPLSIALAPLVEEPHWGGLVSAETLRAAVRGGPEDGRHRSAHAWAQRVITTAVGEAAERLRGDAPALRALRALRQGFDEANADWLLRYERLRSRSGRTPAERADVAERFRVAQFIVHLQHRELRDFVDDLGLGLFGDLPIGLSAEDEACFPGIFLESHRMGAPPSRTNPAGQPWGYPVLDPEQVAGNGAALRFFRSRVDRAFADYDGLRIDHPHGLVDPWVYDVRDSDPARAVQDGARLFSSPALVDHAGLRRFAIARSDQLRPGDVPRYADDWVLRLDPNQVDRYAVLIDAVLASARAVGRTAADVPCEVLSTLPYPLGRVLSSRGLGRFRVTQKHDPGDPDDPYRSARAAEEDWIMVGTHDTAPLWRVVDRWQGEGRMDERAGYLAERLVPDPSRRAAAAGAWSRSPEDLAAAELADLFAGPARQVMVFFADLLGETAVYNAPGAVSESNWTLRVPPDWPSQYARRLAAGRAFNPPAAVALALRSRGRAHDAQTQAILARLDDAAAALRSGAIPAPS